MNTRVETTMWLLLVVFTLHELEEIMMLDAWLKRNGAAFRGTRGKLISFLLKKHSSLSTASFSLIVLVEYLALSALLVYCIQTSSVDLWASALFAFQFHIVIHLVQFLVLRRYTPALVTSILSSVYFLFTISQLHEQLHLTRVIAAAGALLVVMAAHLALGFKYASAFQRWLNRYRCG